MRRPSFNPSPIQNKVATTIGLTVGGQVELLHLPLSPDSLRTTFLVICSPSSRRGRSGIARSSQSHQLFASNKDQFLGLWLLGLFGLPVRVAAGLFETSGTEERLFPEESAILRQAPWPVSCGRRRRDQEGEAIPRGAPRRSERDKGDRRDAEELPLTSTCQASLVRTGLETEEPPAHAP